MSGIAFQDQGSIQHCFGCGANNQKGLQLKSYRDGGSSIAQFVPEPFHCGGSPDIVYGGLIASLIDCHACNHAVADAYQAEGRSIGSEPRIVCVTAQLNVSLMRPTSITAPIELRAFARESDGRKVWIDCEVTSEGSTTAKGEVLTVRLNDAGTI